MGHQHPPPLITAGELKDLVRATSHVILSSDMRAYMHDIIIFLRTHRALSITAPAGSAGYHQQQLPGPGVSAQATRHFHALVKALAALHGLDYVTPSLVTLAARKIYPHRLRISSPARDRALLYGGDLAATREWYADLTVDDVLEEILASVEAPL